MSDTSTYLIEPVSASGPLLSAEALENLRAAVAATPRDHPDYETLVTLPQRAAEARWIATQASRKEAEV